MVDPGDLIGKPLPESKGGSTGTARGCPTGCLIAGVPAFVVFLVVVYGIGLPNTYWHRIGPVQIFEGGDVVVVFAEVDLVTLRPGLVRSPPTVWEPVRFYRIDLSRAGLARKERLRLPEGASFNRNLSRIVGLRDGFHLIGMDRVMKLDGGLVEPIEGLGIGRDTWDNEVLEKISQENGWRLLNNRHHLGPHREPVDSGTMDVRIRLARTDPCQLLVAESRDAGNRRVIRLLEVNSKKWKSYRSPSVARSMEQD